MEYEAPKFTENKFNEATNEMWFKNDLRYCFADADGQFNQQCPFVLASDIAVDQKTQKSHAEWVKNSARWQGGSSSFRQDRIEITPPGGWYYKPPSAVPLSYDRATISDYGPREFAEFEGKNKFYCHDRIKPHEFHPQESMRFMKYGI